MTGVEALAGIGADPRRGGWSRHGFDDADLALREWFTEAAARCGLDVETDRNGNQWAWWGSPGPDAVVTGSHLDSVPGGGAFDGPLGVLSALQAVEALQAQGFHPSRPIAVVVFVEEEGGRFGVPCLGSRLLTGVLDPADALRLTDPAGMTLADAVRRAGLDPDRLGRDPEILRRIGTFIELHVEQGRALEAPVGLATEIVPHGRWRFRLAGRGDHAGTAALAGRRDPMLPAAALVLAAREVAAAAGCVGTVGRLAPQPGATNAVASIVDAWLDVRATSSSTVDVVVAEIQRRVGLAAAEHGCILTVRRESVSGPVSFDPELRTRLAGAVGGEVPALPTAAGHDAGLLAGHVPTAMLFVRNPTGISHAPDEHAEPDDCAAGVAALAAALRDLAG